MNLSLYSAATGMSAQQTNLDAISNNIANVNTAGFKRSSVEFQDLLYQTKRSTGAEAGGGNVVPTSVQLGNGVQVVSTGKVFTQGQLTETGRQLDVAIQGDGFFTVELPDGTEAYSRDGGFKLDADGRIVTNDGLPVQGWQSVPSGTTDISVASDGTVTYLNPNGNVTFQVELTRFVNPTGLSAIGRNLYTETDASGQPETGTPAQNNFGRLIQNHLEISNVNVVQEMVNMITAQRAYEINSKSIQTSDQMLATVNQLKR